MNDTKDLKDYILNSNLTSEIDILTLSKIMTWQPPKGSWKKKRLQHFLKYLEDEIKQNK